MKKIFLFLVIFLISQMSWADNVLTFKIQNNTSDTFQLNTDARKTFCTNSASFVSKPETISPNETAPTPVSVSLGDGKCMLTYNASAVLKSSLGIAMWAPQNFRCSNTGYTCAYDPKENILMVYLDHH